MHAGWLVWLAGVVVAVALLAPAWLVFAAGGVLLGWATRGLLRWLRSTRHPRLILVGAAGLTVVVLLAFAAGTPSLMKARLAGISQSHVVHYSAEVRYDAAEKQWRIRDRIEVQLNPRLFATQMLESQAVDENGPGDPDRGGAPGNAEQRWLADGLREYGWTSGPAAAEGHVFYRERTAEVRQPWYAVRTDNRIPVLSPARDLPSSWTVYPYGTLVLQVPRRLVGATKPEATRREPAEQGAAEAVCLPFEFPLLSQAEGRPFVQVEVIHTLLRNPVVAGIRQLAGMPIINWLLAALCGVFQERLRERLVRPLVARLGRWCGLRWFAEADGVSAGATVGAGFEGGPACRPLNAAAHPRGILAALYDDRAERRRRVA